MVELVSIMQCPVCYRYFQDMTKEGAMWLLQKHCEEYHVEDIERGGPNDGDSVQSQKQPEGLS